MRKGMVVEQEKKKEEKKRDIRERESRTPSSMEIIFSHSDERTRWSVFFERIHTVVYVTILNFIGKRERKSSNFLQTVLVLK